MQGFIFFHFQEYVKRSFGPSIWAEVAEKAQISGKDYSFFESYPITELRELSANLAAILQKPCEKLLEEFGTDIFPSLWNVCKRLVPAKWTLLDVLQNLTHFRGHLLASAALGTDLAPHMQCERTGSREVTIRLFSIRTMDAFGRGVVKGLAKHYQTNLTISEPKCLRRGDSACEVVFFAKRLE